MSFIKKVLSQGVGFINKPVVRVSDIKNIRDIESVINKNSNLQPGYSKISKHIEDPLDLVYFLIGKSEPQDSITADAVIFDIINHLENLADELNPNNFQNSALRSVRGGGQLAFFDKY